MTGEPQPTVLYEVDNRKAYLTLNRPERLNAIDFRMPGDIAAAVRRANDDPGVHVIVLQGAGRAFCSGYDLRVSAEEGAGTQGSADGSTQILATLFDGITRHSPEGRWFVEFAQTHGFDAAVRWRDEGRFIPDGGGPIPSAEDLAGRPE